MGKDARRLLSFLRVVHSATDPHLFRVLKDPSHSANTTTQSLPQKIRPAPRIFLAAFFTRLAALPPVPSAAFAMSNPVLRPFIAIFAAATAR